MDNIEEHIVSEPSDELLQKNNNCIICQDNTEEEIIKYQHGCGNYWIHNSCLNIWFQHSGFVCVICRNNIIDDDDDDDDDDEQQDPILNDHFNYEYEIEIDIENQNQNQNEIIIQPPTNRRNNECYICFIVLFIIIFFFIILES